MKSPEELPKKRTLRANEGENAETLAVIEEGLADAKAGRTVSLEEARNRLRKRASGF
jgi:predicted transcriptional regulator